MANVLLITLGTDGDVRPFILLGGALKARGHAVSLLTHAYYADRAGRAGLDFAALDQPADRRSSTAAPFETHTAQGMVALIQRYIIPSALQHVAKIRERSRPGPGDTVLIANHTASLAADLAAEHLQLPHIPVFFSPIQLGTLPMLRAVLSSTVGAEVNRVREQIGLPPVDDWENAWRYPAGGLALWPDWFAPAEVNQLSGVTPIGFLVDTVAQDIPAEAQALLANGERPILITGGTGVFVSAEFYTASVAACRRLGRQSIVVTRHPEILKDYRETMKWFEFLPFGSVMPHLGAVIHHGGIGTAAQALAAGIPQVALAVGVDRPDNAARLQRLGVGRFLPPPRWEAGAIAEALQQLTTSTAVQAHCREFADRLRESDPVTAACEWIERRLADGTLQNQAALAPSAPSGCASARAGDNPPLAPLGGTGDAPAAPRVKPDTPQPPARESDVRVDAVTKNLARLSPERLELLTRSLKQKSQGSGPRPGANGALGSPQQTLAELAGEGGNKKVIQPTPDLTTGPVPLTLGSLWFFRLKTLPPYHLNLPVLVEIDHRLDPDRMRQAVQCVVRHHDALNLRFRPGAEGWQAFIVEPDAAGAPFTYFDFSGLSPTEHWAAIEAAAAELQTRINIIEGPLLQVAYMDLGLERPGRLLILLHHLASDAFSQRIVFDDLQTAYRQLNQGQAVDLPAKTTTFKHWSERLSAYARSAEALQHLDYWLSRPWDRLARLPLDYPEPPESNTLGSMRKAQAALSADETERLLRRASQAYGGPFMVVLLTAMTQTLVRWTGVPALLVEVMNHGRETSFKDVDLSRTVGWLAIGYPALLELSGSMGLEEAWLSIREQLRNLPAVPNLGMSYQLLRDMRGDPALTEQLWAWPQPEVVFNYLGQSEPVASRTSPLRPAAESPGSGGSPLRVRHRLLEYFIRIVGGQLIVSIDYSENMHRPATVEGLAQDFIEALRSLLEGTPC